MKKIEVETPLLIQGKFVRFRERLPFEGRKTSKLAPCSVIIGAKNTGKSSLNENLATHYPKILDFFGSRDNEGLAWCRSPYADSILFILSDSVDLKCSWDTKHIKDVEISDFRKYKVILSVSAFFGRLMEEHHFIQTIMGKLWHRTHWTEPWFLAIREAANLIYSRISVGEDQKRAKAYFIYVLREMRHCGYAVGADAIRFRSVDIDLRAVADYTFIKATGVYGVPYELRFLYSYFEPYSVMRMPQERFILLTRKGTICRGWFEYPPWHKDVKDDLLKEFDIHPEYGEQIDYGDKGYKRVSDFEHEKMVITRHEDENGNARQVPLSFQKITERMNRSSSATIWKEITSHNEAVEKVGKCPRCARIRSHMQSILV